MLDNTDLMEDWHSPTEVMKVRAEVEENTSRADEPKDQMVEAAAEKHVPQCRRETPKVESN
jgi:hypothetical protein